MDFQNAENELKISFETFKERVLEDYRLAVLSRECSLLGRREVFSGKGKFGIFGDGKELPQLAMNHFFQNGDFRSGYYRDQTLLMAQGLLTVSNIFAALYAHLDITKEPMSGGRQMGGHFATPLRNEKGEWLDTLKLKNHSGDISPTGSQMPRLLGLAQASKVYRAHPTKNSSKFSENGNEIAWGTIGLDVFPVHGVGGILGTFLAGIFASSALGVFSGQGYAEGMTMGSQLVVQLTGIIATAAYTGVLTVVILKVVNAVTGMRVTEEDESVGLDIVLHDERGYDI